MAPQSANQVIRLRVTPEQAQSWQAAADAAGYSRHRWAIMVLDVASGTEPLAEQLERAQEAGGDMLPRKTQKRR